MTCVSERLIATQPELFPHKWTAGDKNPGLVVTFPDLELITNGLTIKACIRRPTDVLTKTFTNVDEYTASFSWAPTDLVAGIGQVVRFFAENGSGERTHLSEIMIDVREKDCT